MLDAIASAPFLTVVSQAGEAEWPEDAVTAQGEMAPSPAAETVEERGEGRQREPAPAAREETVLAESPVERPSERVSQTLPAEDHEIAASPAEARFVEPQGEEPRVEPETDEARRHAIHGAPGEPETAGEPAPRKMGWWSRRKTG